MREIIFRGKRTDSSEWVEGFLWCEWYAMRQRNDYHIYTFNKTDDGEIFLTGNYNVDPETIGQYTGLSDKNGKRIFEGDIVCYRNAIFGVEWSLKYCAYLVVSKFSGGEDLLINYDNCEVIGNIHDSPELLEVQG